MKLIFLILIFWAEVTFPLTAAADESAPELEAVIVSAPLEPQLGQSAQPATVLRDDELRLKTGHSIGETLKQESGITSQSFGPGVGSPVIRGQAGPRVKVLQNGIGSNDVSSLSPDHANSVEPVLAERLEVLRGPATLLYGSGAIGGVVNVIDNRVPSLIPDKLINLTGEQRYESVSSETTSALKLDSGAGRFALHLDGFYRERGNTHIGGYAIDEASARASDPSLAEIPRLQNSRGVIGNTNAHSIGGSVGASYVGDEGFIGVAINRLENNYGIPPDGSGEAPVRIDLKQTKYDLRSEWKRPFDYAEALKLKFGYTDYRHVELEGGQPGTTWSNRSYESRLELVHQPVGALRGVLGFQSNHSDFAAVGEEAVVPPSLIETYGLFAVESLDMGALTYELGARVEHQSVAPQGAKARNDLPLSGSASAHWKIDEHQQFSLAFAHSQRAPQVQELYSNGVHAATRSFEIGNPDLNREISNNLDLGYRHSRDWLRLELNLFHNWVNDYIYLQHTGALQEGFPVLQSAQADAIFKGYEGKLVFPLLENHYGLVELTLFSDYTRGEFSRRGDVPRMPPLRYGFQLDYVQTQWSANVRLTRGEPQEHPGFGDTATSGYVLLNMGAQYQFKALETASVTLFAKGNNLLDENIRNSTSYLRNSAPEPGRSAELGIRLQY